MGKSKAKREPEGNEDTATPKRQRVSRACDRCRVARQKCDGERPTCGACDSANIECTYAAGSRRRGIQSGYIRTIELALSWCVFNVPGCEDSLKTLLHSENGRRLLTNAEEDTSTRMHRRWRKTVISKRIDRLLSSPQPDENAEEDEDGEERQATSDSAGLEIDFENIIGPQSSSKRQRNGSSLLQDENQDVGLAASLGSNNTPKLLPDNFSQLIDIYFAYTHCWLPVVSHESVLKLCYSYPDDGLDLSSTTPGAGAYAELWSILAIASFQSQHRKLHESARSHEDVLSHGSALSAKQMLSYAEDLIPKESASFEKGHGSSLLLLTLFNIGTDDHPSAWMTVGLAIRVILLLYQNSDPLGSPAATQDRDSLKPLLLACFVLETFLCVPLKTTPHLRSQDIPVGLLDEEGLDEWQRWTACPGFVSEEADARPKKSAPMLSHSIFNQLVRLSIVLNDSLAPSNTRSLIQASTPESALLDWTRQMPAKVRGLYSITENEPTPHRLNLLLAYLVIKSICNPANRQVAVDEALPVFDIYARTLGHAVIPPIFTLFASIFQREDVDALRRQRLGDIRSQIRTVWDDARHPLQPRASHLMPTPSLLHTTSPSLPDSLRPGSMLGMEPSIGEFDSYQQSQFAMNIPPAPQSLYDGPPLEPYSSNSMMDLDALFDDLTSFDGAEHQSAGPAFMQNLGFSANSNLTDLMTGNFGWNYNPP
jgi:Fungal specific transcription factor domain/Fungal Zn(2)-Cys(6) binuclear cluster domain